MLTDAEKKELLRIARNNLESAVKGTPKPESKAMSEALGQERGVFVTLKKQGDLRGCIGYIQPVKPLYIAVGEMAVSAGTGDPRFSPVGENELSDITIEISVLSPMKQIKDVEEIEVGRDGIYIVKDYYSGVLLPQVATEHDWDGERFIEETCLKAGLPPDAWEKGAQVYTFSAEIFGETDE